MRIHRDCYGCNRFTGWADAGGRVRLHRDCYGCNRFTLCGAPSRSARGACGRWRRRRNRAAPRTFCSRSSLCQYKPRSPRPCRATCALFAPVAVSVNTGPEAPHRHRYPGIRTSSTRRLLALPSGVALASSAPSVWPSIDSFSAGSARRSGRASCPLGEAEAADDQRRFGVVPGIEGHAQPDRLLLVGRRGRGSATRRRSPGAGERPIMPQRGSGLEEGRNDLGP